MISEQEYKKRMKDFKLFMSNYSVMSDFFVEQFENSMEMSYFADKKFKKRHVKHLRKLFFAKYKEVFGADIKPLEPSRAVNNISNAVVADSVVNEPAKEQQAAEDGKTDKT